jgi:hypothetical protein
MRRGVPVPRRLHSWGRVMFGLSQIQLIIIGGLLAAVITAGGIAYIYDAGGDSREGAVTGAVQSKTIETLDAARGAKERADADVRATPYEGRVDGLK